MRLWQSRKTAQLKRERREAEAARQEASMQKARVQAQNSRVKGMVAQLARNRDADQLAGRIQTAFQHKWAADASRTVGKVNSFAQELTAEADRRREGGPAHD